jgi:hypothetical protein
LGLGALLWLLALRLAVAGVLPGHHWFGAAARHRDVDRRGGGVGALGRGA